MNQRWKKVRDSTWYQLEHEHASSGICDQEKTQIGQRIRAVWLYILRNTAYTSWIVYALQVLNANSE